MFNNKRPMPGKITLVLGPMFSGKSTELLRLVRRSSIANKRVLIVKYLLDTRFSDDKLITHSGEHATEDTVPAGTVSEIFDTALHYDVIAIDEGQFFPDLRKGILDLVAVDKEIIISALDGSFKQEIFKPIADTIPIADKIIKLSAICRYCFKDAPFTRRLVQSTELEIIGGSELYAPVCRKCLYAKVQ